MKVWRKQVEEFVYQQTRGMVQSGPFAGMQMTNATVWPDGALCPLLLGCHEQELHEVIEHEIARVAAMPNPRVVNVGCAEGYYAVGLARRLPHATIWAIDVSSAALDATRKLAEANGVTNIVIGDDLSQVFDVPDLIVMDCEGYEIDYLDPERFPGITRAHIIVEVHNGFRDDGILENRAQIILAKCQHLFSIVAVREGPRDPNEFAFLRHLTSLFRWLTVCENRPCMMGWFVMIPKEVAGAQSA